MARPAGTCGVRSNGVRCDKLTRMLPLLMLLLGLLLGFVLLVIVGLLIAVRYRGAMARLPLPRVVRFAFIDHTLLGEPVSTDRILHRAGYSLGYDDTLRAARWVSYVVTRASHTVGDRRVARSGESFRPDPDIPLELQHLSKAYTNSGYDRGHMAPSATVDFTERSNDQTFFMSNVLPQHPKLNRQAWRSLENDVRRWTTTHGRMVVVCGPIFGHPPRKQKGLCIPTHFFKVVYAWKHHRTICFVVPNRAVPAKERWSHTCSVADVERAAGIRLFRGPRWWLWRIDRGASDVDWWKKPSRPL